MIVFADTSAIGSAYLGDKVAGPWISEVIFNGPNPVVMSELADVEFASLLVRAKSDGRISARELATCLASYRESTADDGPLGVIPITHESFELAEQFVLDTSIRTLDALHLATAQLFADTNHEDVVVLTLDRRQAAAARALGMTIHGSPESL